MESTENQIKQELIRTESNIFKCDACKIFKCSKCEGKNRYINGFLCNSCYKSFHIRSNNRRVRIKEKKKLRNQYPAFSFELKSAKHLKTILNGLESLSNKGYLLIMQNQIAFTNYDDARICFLSFRYPTTELKVLTSSRDLQQISFNIAEFSEAVESLLDHEQVIFQRKKGRPDILINPEGSSKTIMMHPIEDYEPVSGKRLLDHKYPVSFSIEKSKLIEILSDCKNFNKYNLFTIECTEKTVSFKSEGETMIYNYPFTSEELENYRYEENTSQLYWFDPLLKFLEQTHEIIDDINISVRKEYPLKININEGQGYFIIAPRVSYNDDEEDD